MKVKNMLEFIKVKEGAEIDLSMIDLSELETEWNRQYNGMKVSIQNETKDIAIKEVLSKYGLENIEDIQTLIDSTKSNDEKTNEEIKKLTETIETIQTDLKNKDAELLKRTQFEHLRGIDLGDGKIAKIKQDKLDYAHKLIVDKVTDEVSFEDAAKQFVQSTPEWLEGTSKRGIDLGGDGDSDGEDTGTKVDDMW